MFWVSSIVIIKKIPIEDTQKKMRKEKSTSLPKIHWNTKEDLKKEKEQQKSYNTENNE